MWWGKIIGLFLGYFLAGWVGALIGLILGHVSDVIRHHPVIQHTRELQKLFFDATFLIMGYIAKSDGRVSEAEIHAARQIMERMGLDETHKERAMYLFQEGKNANFSLDNTINQILRAAHGNFILLQVFMDLQLQAVRLSGDISPAKQDAMQKVFSRLGYRPFQFHFQEEHISSHFRKDNLEDAYNLLGVETTASNEEIKQAYRKLMSKHHPDKLASQGLPEEVMKMATEKAQKIQLAYDQIRKIRGF